MEQLAGVFEEAERIVHKETLVTVKWIAARLGLGTAGYLNNQLYRWRKGTLECVRQ